MDVEAYSSLLKNPEYFLGCLEQNATNCTVRQVMTLNILFKQLYEPAQLHEKGNEIQGYFFGRKNEMQHNPEKRNRIPAIATEALKTRRVGWKKNITPREGNKIRPNPKYDAAPRKK